MIQEQQVVDQPSSNAMSGTSKASIIRLIALMIISAAVLLIFITTGMVFYDHHHHRQLNEKSITKDLQSTTTTDSSNSVGPKVISISSTNIPSAEKQALLKDLYESSDGAQWSTDGSHRNSGFSSTGIHWSSSNPEVAKNRIDVAANQAVSLKKGM